MIYERQGQRWTPEEDSALREAYRAGIPIEDLAKTHQRSPAGIHARLIRQGEIKVEGKVLISSSSRAILGWTYLILSERGEVYLGATTNLQKRLRAHNSPKNRGWTRGRKWHLLAVRNFATEEEAFTLERALKKNRKKRRAWTLQCIERANKIARRYGYGFSPSNWPERAGKKAPTV